jgi:protein O-GlcNAc transferase
VVSGGKDSAAAFHGLGIALWRQRRLDEGLEALRLAVERAPKDVEYRLSLAAALDKTSPAEAVEQLREARRLAPDRPEIDARIHKPLMEICAWDELQTELDALLEHARKEPAERWTLRIDPFVALALPLPPELRARAIRGHSLRAVRGLQPIAARPRAAGAKLRVAYLAGEEFANHAVAHLSVGLFEQHDRERFEVSAYSYGPDDGSEYRRRVCAAFDRFVEIGSLTDAEAAARIAADRIDILLDLKGYTSGARPRLWGLRPAPVQVNYLGYPGSMQVEAMDYIVGDSTVLPQSDFATCSEAVVWMPGSYQANDDRQAIAPHAATRADQGLPERGVVFCCFNRSYKIQRADYAAWMRILRAIPDAVLWLLPTNPVTDAALRAAAVAEGVDPLRLIFAPRQKKPEHLARHALADVFLDTYTYNAHTTGSDALWAGVPMITRIGDSFAGRVAASLLRAVGLPELVTARPEEYERLAIELARDPVRRGALRARLAHNRTTMALFRTADYTRQLERAFEVMHARRCAGRAPEAFAV